MNQHFLFQVWHIYFSSELYYWTITALIIFSIGRKKGESLKSIFSSVYGWILFCQFVSIQLQYKKILFRFPMLFGNANILRFISFSERVVDIIYFQCFQFLIVFHQVCPIEAIWPSMLTLLILFEIKTVGFRCDVFLFHKILSKIGFKLSGSLKGLTHLLYINIHFLKKKMEGEKDWFNFLR